MTLLMCLFATTLAFAEGWTDDGSSTNAITKAVIKTDAAEPYLEVHFLDEVGRPVVVRMTVAEAKARQRAATAWRAPGACGTSLDDIPRR